jgi:glutamine amidotransferase
MAADIVVLDYGSGNLRSAERALARVGANVQVTADLDAALNCDGLVVPGVGAFAACMAGIRGVGGDKVIAQRIELGRPVLGICVGMQVLFSAGVEHGFRTEGCEAWPGTVDRLDAPVLPHMGWNTVTPADGSVLFAGIDAGTRFYFVHSFALRMRDAGPLLHLDVAAIRASRQPVAAPGSRAPAEHGEPGVVPEPQPRASAAEPGSRPRVTVAEPGSHPRVTVTGPGSHPRVTVTEHGEAFAAAVEDGLVSATQFHPEKSGDAGAEVLRNWLGTV